MRRHMIKINIELISYHNGKKFNGKMEMMLINYSKTCLKRPLKKKTQNCFSRPILSLNACQKYCRMLQESIVCVCLVTLLCST